MTVLITLTTVGADSGPTYNLYSSPDGTTFTPFATGITKLALLAGYPDTVPDGTTTIRVTSIGTLCTNSKDLTVGVVPTTTTTTTPSIQGYCVNWTAGNNGNINMQTVGYIDFTVALAGRTIVAGLSTGTVTGYVIAGVGTFTCSIPMTFTTTKAQWNTNSLPAVTDKVLTSLIYSVTAVFSDSDEYIITDEQTNAIVIPGQTTSSFNNCPTTTTSTSSTTTTTTTAAPTVYTYYFSVGRTSSLQACGETIPYDNIFYSDSIALDLTSILYTNPSLITPVNGGGQWFKDLDSEVAYQISTSPTPGEIVDFFNCVP